MRSTGVYGKQGINIKGISQVMVSTITSSLIKIDRIQQFIEKNYSHDLYHYRFRVSIGDGVAVLGLLLFSVGIWVIEKGYWV